MLGHLRILLSAALAIAALAGPSLAFAQERPEFIDRMFGRGERTRDEAPPRVAQASPTDVIVRLERLEGLVRQLTGLVEQLQYRNQQLEQQVRRLQEDPRPTAQPVPPPARPPATAIPAAPPPAGTPPAPGRRSDAFDPTVDPGAPGAPRTLGALPGQPAALPPPGVAPAPGCGPRTSGRRAWRTRRRNAARPRHARRHAWARDLAFRRRAASRRYPASTAAATAPRRGHCGAAALADAEGRV